MNHESTITVGLDFGTYQTKICLQVRKGASKRYYFVPFEMDGINISSYLFPSTISIFNDGSYIAGSSSHETKKTYGFFKIASAKDEEFINELNSIKETTNLKDKYDSNAFEPYSPELLSIVYLANIIGCAKDFANHNVIKKSEPKGGFWERFGENQVEEQYVWHYRMGVPTEYHSSKNQLRKRKFEQILYLAKKLHESISYKELKNSSFSTLIESINNINNNLLTEFGAFQNYGINPENWKKIISKEQISVFPETAAGLMYLVNSDKLESEKHYVSMDVGGGSTDLSFFKVEANKTFTYLASKSVMLASNDILFKALNQIDSEIIRARLQNSQIIKSLENEHRYIEAVKSVKEGLDRHLYKMFNGQVYRRANNRKATSYYSGSECFIYGGGTMLPKIRNIFDKVLLHDNGVRARNANVTKIYADVTFVDQLAIYDSIEPDFWQSHIRVLLVALGLSLSMPDDHMHIHIEEDFNITVEDNFDKIMDYSGSRPKWV